MHAVDSAPRQLESPLLGYEHPVCIQMNKVEHNAVVYTPCSIHDDGLHTYNITVPEGMLCSDVLPDPGVTYNCCVTSKYMQRF